MSLETQSFEFDDFLLNTREKVLLRGGKPVPITPKAFQLLVELVKNHGHLLAKDELMKAVWADSFVEDGNLAFTIRLLRKALDDTAQNPRFIETVAKRGYRFIGDVSRIEQKEKSAPEYSDKSISRAADNEPDQSSGTENAENNFLISRQNELQNGRNIKAVSQEISRSQEISHIISSAPHTLFGRRREIAAIKNLLHKKNVRLVTLTGVGGSGKTSLARVIDADCVTDFPDGIFFIELAPVFNPELVAGAIARTLDIKESGDGSLLENVQAFLRERRVLLILDNFEQILSASPLLNQLILATRQLKILVTSRVALRVSTENELLIPPLAVPAKDLSVSEIIESENYPSVQMFVERAQRVKPNFVLSEENAFDVAAICADLNGLPLAIELAAARIKLLTPSAILERLENRLQILTTRLGTLPARHQTMRHTIAWSFDLLDEKEKKLFTRLAVFAGGFTIEAAEAICGGEEVKKDSEVLDGLEALVANNLLQHLDESGKESRLLMLETIREYAAERLAENASEETELRRRHADFFLKYARQMERDLMGERQAQLINRMEAERDNFGAAMDWWRKNDGENELKLTAALTPLWNFRGTLSEGIERLTDVIERNPNAAPAARVKALTSLGMLTWVSSDYVKAIEICEQSLLIFKQIDYPIIKAQTLFVMGMSYWYKFGDAGKSIAYLKESLDLYREVKFDTGVVFTTVVLAAIYQTGNDLTKAAQLLDESMSAAERSGNNLARSIALVNYGRLKFAEGNYERAKQLCQQSLRLREELADRWGLVQCLEPLTAIAVIEDAPQHAAKLLGAIDVLLETLGAQPPLIFRADHEPSAAAVRAALDEKTFERLFAEGRKLSIKESVALALDEPLDFSQKPKLHESVFTIARRFAGRFFR